MAAGIPVIVTGFGGHMDFCFTGTARLVAYRLAPSGSHLATPHSLWAEPDVADLTQALREVFAAGRHGLMEQRQAARAAIALATNPADWTARLTSAAAALLLAPPAPTTRTAWISTWDVGCGIAEYARALLDAMPREGITVLADERTPARPHVHPAWRLGDPKNVDRLTQAVARLDADIVVIQHQPGLMEWAMLAQLVRQLVYQGRGVVVTLHNTRHLVESAEPGRTEIVDALALAARVLVHTLTDVQALAEIGMTNPAVLVPHAAPAALSPALRSLPPGAAPIIGCTGFFLPGKGIGTLIQAVASLRDRWPAIQLRLVNAEYDHPDSAAEIAACRALGKSERFEVDWRTSFLPVDEIGRSLCGCDLLVLPYEYSKESSSAALRTALGTGIPVAVTPLALFDEAVSAVAILPGSDVLSVARGIAALLDDQTERTRLQVAAQAWLGARAVSDIGRRLSGMIEGLAAQRRIGQPLNGGLPVPLGERRRFG
jgi:glycosyltransferase involved in cell wall biosynthesis